MTAFIVAVTVHTCIRRRPGRSSSGTRVHTTPDALATSTAATRSQTRSYSSSATSLDGFYVLRTPVPASQLDATAVVSAYKNPTYVERDFRHIKADDLDLRPVFHRPDQRVRAHALICMLGCYLTWHLRRGPAPLTFTDENPPEQENPSPPPVARPAPRPRPPISATRPGSPTAASGACWTTWPTLTRNQLRFAGTRATIPCSPSRPAPSARPSPSSAPPSRSP